MPGDFSTGSALHFASLAIAVGLTAGMALLLHRRCDQRSQGRLRLVIGYGCLVVWVVNTGYWCWPNRFHWTGSLPLHFCNLANLIGALAVLARWRLCQALLYFWAFAFCIWAFVTPTVEYGPGHVAFWIFWIYHLFIFFAVVEVLIVDRFAPTNSEFYFAAIATAIYAGLLGVLNYMTGWNYGFLGADQPETPTVLDHLGSYPWSIVKLYVAGALAFTLLMVPFWIARRRSVERDLPA